MISDLLSRHIADAASTLKLPIDTVQLEHPADESHGDYSTNFAMIQYGKTAKKMDSDEPAVKRNNPRKLAEKIADILKKDKELEKVVSKIEVAGPGFINFWLSTNYLLHVLQSVLDSSSNPPPYHLGENKKIMVEFAHFNTHKAVHIGHVRNIALGESLSRILEVLRNDVVRVSYGGDVGLHIAKCLYSLRQSRQPANSSQLSLDEKVTLLAQSYTSGNNAYEDDEKAREEILSINKKIYDKHPDIYPLWKETKEWSLEQFDRIYKRVNTRFDQLYYESDVYEKGLELSNKALAKGILEKSKGAIVFKGERYGLDTRVFVTGEGNPTYEGKELGIADLETRQYPDIDKIIHVVAPEQKSFFEVTFKVEELLDPARYTGLQYHFAYGYVRLTSGKMSSRKGTIVLGEWLFDEVKRRIRATFPDVSSSVADTIAVSAVKYSMLKIDSRQDISFDIDQSISLDGNSGPYLQYTYARARSVLNKQPTATGKQLSKLPITNYKLQAEEKAILRTLYKYPETVYAAGQSFSPNLIANYLFDLAQKFNLFYQKVPILKPAKPTKTRRASGSKSDRLKETNDIQQFRLALTKATSETLKKGLSLLGIETLERM